MLIINAEVKTIFTQGIVRDGTCCYQVDLLSIVNRLVEVRQSTCRNTVPSVFLL